MLNQPRADLIWGRTVNAGAPLSFVTCSSLCADLMSHLCEAGSRYGRPLLYAVDCIFPAGLEAGSKE